MRRLALVMLSAGCAALAIASAVTAGNGHGQGKALAKGQAAEKASASAAGSTGSAVEDTDAAAEAAATPKTAAAPGNGAPSGPHYNLNIIGVPNPKTADMTGSSRHSLFVKLTGSSKINLCQSGTANCAPDGGFQVLDGNGTDANGALFALPSPDPDPTDDVTGCPVGSTCTTSYSVYARQLGDPKGSATMTTCKSVDGSTYCDTGSTVMLTTRHGKSEFQNVSKQLLTIGLDTDGDGKIDFREYLFGEPGAQYYWDYNNAGLRLAQLRFYMIASTFVA